MSHSVRLEDNVFACVKNTQRRLNERKRGQRKAHKYSLSEVIEWYILAANNDAANP
jgi:uncharacterized protein involved in tolerance to divalent cations